MTNNAERGAGSAGHKLRRRSLGIAAAGAAALSLTLLVWLWVPLLAAADLLRGKRRLPMMRLVAFGAAMAWLELAGVTAAGWLWTTGRGRSVPANRRLQKWWAQKVMAALERTCGLRPTVEGIEALRSGPLVLLVRHASLADSLLTAWAVMHGAGMWPRVVMKKELLVDPCLDIVGNRLPNCFVDRAAADSAPELAAIAAMGADMEAEECSVIFPEGTRSNPAKRERAIERIGESDEARAERLAALEHLLPPRHSGAVALLSAAPHADVVFGWHAGFEGLDTFGGIIEAIGSGRRSALIHFDRIDRSEVPTGDEFGPWLDEKWLELDSAVGVALEAGVGTD
ncbi:MAG: 1-acyl-sn-glycerol-3-phosphate acyltransferase [Microthrixaceae bacterium]